MKEIRLSKGGGKVRVVYAPSPRAKSRLRARLPELMRAERRAAAALGVAEVAHGFIAGRSPVTCALAHVGFVLTVSCDLSGWFDSVTAAQVARGLVLGGYGEAAAAALAERLCHLGAPRQGLPTSPAAANLAAVPMDRLILDALAEMGQAFAYTRYADDLTVSVGEDSPELAQRIVNILAGCASAMGWRVATHKTHIQRAAAGRRVIVGVSVENDLRAPRKVRRRLRAANHKARTQEGNAGTGARNSAAGLAEWCSLKLPKEARPSRQLLGVSGHICLSAQARAAAPEVLEGGTGQGRRIVFAKQE